ncbi:hypothetical protein GQR58_029604 [Nymphon striatum]|nr:hypothetical protein GQR58_029604 [Nymphon striatum]
MLVWPDLGNRVLTRTVALGLLILGASSAWTAAHSDRLRWVRVAGAAVAIVVGVWLLVSVERRPDALGRIIGLVATLAGAYSIGLRWTHHGSRPPLRHGTPVLVTGLALLAFPGTLFTTGVIVFALGGVLLGIAAISVTLNPSTPSMLAYDSDTELLVEWLTDRPKRADSRRELYDKILFEGADTSRRVIRFVVLMSFAAVIASMGVITDSTAVVIGAMLIAPLMTPLMGMAISLVMGWPRRLARSTAMAALGIAIAVLIGLLLGLVVPAVIDTSTNSQILARTSPTMLDLIVAVAAGAAGAYALSRPDVSDSLPGVAIAISLVPPLTVVGISYSQGDWARGHGALLLYATNMVAILVMGGLTFIVTGVTPISRVTENQQRLRTWGMTVVVAVALVVGALFLNGAQIAGDALAQDNLERVVREWLEPHERHEFIRTSISDDVATAVIVGPRNNAPTADSLAVLLAAEFDRPTTAVVRLVYRQAVTDFDLDGLFLEPRPDEDAWEAFLNLAFERIEGERSPGLTNRQIGELEAVLGTMLPFEVGLMLVMGVPTADPWRQWDQDPAEAWQAWNDQLRNAICVDIEHEDFWFDGWGAKPAVDLSTDRSGPGAVRCHAPATVSNVRKPRRSAHHSSGARQFRRQSGAGGAGNQRAAGRRGSRRLDAPAV